DSNSLDLVSSNTNTGSTNLYDTHTYGAGPNTYVVTSTNTSHAPYIGIIYTHGGTTWNTVVSNTGSAGTTFSDTGLAKKTTYTYRVSAINSVGTSAPSNIASAKTFKTPDF